MKILILLLLILGNPDLVTAQITTPIVKANFGIEADLASNYFGHAQQGSVDDWFNNGHAGTGEFIIDTAGAASIVSGYASNPASRSLSFSRLMKQFPYSIINNSLLLDAVFHRDFHGDDSTVFASGSNKNGMSPLYWSCPIAQGIPDKNDILDAFTHIRREGPNPTDSLWMFAAVSIENTTGSRYFDFELYQTNIVYDRANQVFTGYGPDAGHTSWEFDAAGNITKPGDIIFTAEFSSSSLTLVEARIWVNEAALSITPATFNWGGSFDGDGASATFGYANISPKTAGAFYTGIQNAATEWAGPFQLVRVDNSVMNSYDPRQFMEFSVNLTKLGIEPASFSNNGCGTPFRRVLIKSRASTSFTAELKDFIAPFSMFNYTTADAVTNIPYYCGTMPVTSLNVYNPLPTSVYTWTTVNGHISGPSTGTNIMVDSPGTYYVTQQLHTQCPAFSMDSVTILFDATCNVLNLAISSFTATNSGKEASLRWRVNNNELARSYELQFSLDNKLFSTLAVVNAENKTGAVDYAYQGSLQQTATIIFYRVKLTGKNGSVKYSTVASLTNSVAGSPTAFLFPNPSVGNAWLSYNSTASGNLAIGITDAAGKPVSSFTVHVKEGINLLSLNEFSKEPAGLYIVTIRSIRAIMSLPLVLTR